MHKFVLRYKPSHKRSQGPNRTLGPTLGVDAFQHDTKDLHTMRPFLILSSMCVQCMQSHWEGVCKLSLCQSFIDKTCTAYPQYSKQLTSLDFIHFVYTKIYINKIIMLELTLGRTFSNKLSVYMHSPPHILLHNV